MATTTQDAHAPDAHAAHTEVPHGAEHGGFPPFKPDSFGSQLLWLAIAFGLLWAFMAKIGAPRVASILDQRRGRIEGDLSAAQRLKDQAAAAEQAYEKALGDARRSATKLAEETRQALNAEFTTKKEAEEAKLAVHLAEAEKRIAALRDKAMAEVGTIAVDCAEAIVARLTGGPTREEIGSAVTQSLKQVGSVQ